MKIWKRIGIFENPLQLTSHQLTTTADLRKTIGSKNFQDFFVEITVCTFYKLWESNLTTWKIHGKQSIFLNVQFWYIKYESQASILYDGVQ